MKRVFLTILASVVVFAAGVFAGIWIQRHQPLPPPPTGLMGEIRDVPLSGSDTRRPRDPAQLRAELERLKPEIEAFRQKVEPIKNEFRENLKALLTPEQQEKLKNLSERFHASHLASNGAAAPDSGGPNPHLYHHHDGLESMFPIVLVPITLERLTDELQLTATQRTAVRELLIKRRTQFLELIDSTPPPSVRLGNLAPRPKDAQTPPPAQ